jgi:hypothetical protein
MVENSDFQRQGIAMQVKTIAILESRKLVLPIAVEPDLPALSPLMTALDDH